MYVCMYIWFADGVYNDKVFYAMASECICSSGEVRHGIVGNQLHQFCLKKGQIQPLNLADVDP